MALVKNLAITQGKTFSMVCRWETDPIIRKVISAVDISTGAPRLSVLAHGLTDGWRAAVVMAKGMIGLNAKNNPPKAIDYKKVTVIDVDTVELNSVTPVDDQGRVWPAYVGGGFLQFNTPVDLTGYTVRGSIKDKIGGTVLASTSDVLVITINNTAKTVTITISAENTAAFTWTKGVYEVEMVSSAGEVYTLMSGDFTVSKEIAT